MMRHLFVGVLGAVTAACADAPARVASPAPGGPAYRVAWNPDNGNPRILRTEHTAAFLLIDPATGQFSLQAAWNRQFGCVDPPEIYTLVDIQDILHDPDDPLAAQINELILGRGVYIAVFDGWDAWTGDCGDLFARKLAEGFGTITGTDNDVFVFLRESANSNAFGFVAQGRLTRTGGGAVHYNGVGRCVWDGNTGARFRCTDRIVLR